MKSILVVCEGNICRSPMAQGLLAHSLPEVTVRSAGLGALVGMPADETAIRLMHERGIDIAAHRATQISRAACLEAELVLVMDARQQARVGELYPQLRGRIFRLGEYAKQDIPDPYRQPESAFRHALRLIEDGVSAWHERIDRL